MCATAPVVWEQVGRRRHHLLLPPMALDCAQGARGPVRCQCRTKFFGLNYRNQQRQAAAACSVVDVVVAFRSEKKNKKRRNCVRCSPLCICKFMCVCVRLLQARIAHIHTQTYCSLQMHLRVREKKVCCCLAQEMLVGSFVRQRTSHKTQIRKVRFLLDWRQSSRELGRQTGRQASKQSRQGAN